MTVADSPTPVIAGTLCSLDKERRERLSIPHDAPQSNHCDHCLGNPMGWAPIAFLRLDAAPSTPQLAHAPPLRKQSPGAPPPA